MLGHSQLSPSLLFGAVANCQQFRRIGFACLRGGQMFGGRLSVEFFRRDGTVGQDGNHVVGNLYEPAVDVISNGFAVLDHPQLAITQSANERTVSRGDAQLAVVQGQRDKLCMHLQRRGFRSDDHTFHHSNSGSHIDTSFIAFGHRNSYFAIFLACSSACSIAPTYMNACSGRWSHLPSQISSKLRIVSRNGVISPGLPVNTSATKKGCDKNRSMRRARLTTCLSSSLSSSTPRIAMMSCNSRYRCKMPCTRRAMA